MTLKRVELSTDVYFVCLNHAMCTEGEEIVGLLVGEVDEERVAHVVAVLILRRSDKRKDRVEISPEQLSSASTEAEKLACILKRPVRVIGWYHSHPKLTVYPSLVDVCTQESYQMMDEGFIGMIFSVFNSDPNKFGGRIQMICYQSQSVLIDCNIEKSHLEIPVQLVPSSYISDVCMNSVVQLPRFLCQEEQLAYQMANQVPLDYLTRLHNSSVYLRKMGQVAEVICGPLLKMLEERILNNEMKRKRLQDSKKSAAATLEETKKENAQKELLKQAKAKLKKEKKKKKASLKEQQLPEPEIKQIKKVQVVREDFHLNEILKHNNIQVHENEILSQCEFNSLSLINQLLLTPPSMEDEESFTSTENEELEEAQLEDKNIQEQIELKDHEMEEPAVLKDTDTLTTEDRKIQTAEILEEIAKEKYNVQSSEMQDLPLQVADIFKANEQGMVNKPCLVTKKRQETFQPKKEEKLKNDQFQGRRLQENVLGELPLKQKNITEGFQVLREKVQNVTKANVENKEKRKDAPLKLSLAKSENSATSSNFFVNPIHYNLITRGGSVRPKSAAEFIRAVESLSVSGSLSAENGHEKHSNIPKCNMENIPKIANSDQKLESNAVGKSDVKNSSSPGKPGPSKISPNDANNSPSLSSSVVQDSQISTVPDSSASVVPDSSTSVVPDLSASVVPDLSASVVPDLFASMVPDSSASAVQGPLVVQGLPAPYVQNSPISEASSPDMMEE